MQERMKARRAKKNIPKYQPRDNYTHIHILTRAVPLTTLGRHTVNSQVMAARSRVFQTESTILAVTPCANQSSARSPRQKLMLITSFIMPPNYLRGRHTRLITMCTMPLKRGVCPLVERKYFSSPSKFETANEQF